MNIVYYPRNLWDRNQKYPWATDLYIRKIGRQVITNRKARGRSPYRITGSAEDSGLVNLSSTQQTIVVVFVSVNMLLFIFLCVLQAFPSLFLGQFWFPQVVV